MTEHAESPRCPNCGTEGPRSGKTFCEVCGDYVDWDALATELAAAPPAAPGAVPTPAAGTPTGRPAGTEPSRVTSSEAPASQLGPSPRPQPQPTVQTQPTAQSQPTARADPLGERRPEATPPASTPSQTERARALLVPLAGSSVAPVLPDKPVPPRPEVRPSVPVQESGIECWNCQVGNRPDRRFCRNCGVDLSDAPPAVDRVGPSWWRRLLARLGATRLILAGALLALILLGVLTFPALQRLLTTSAANSAAVLPPPASVSAPQSLDQHPPASAFDGNASSWWGTDASNSGPLTATFTSPVDVSAIRLTPGSPPKPQPQDQPNLPKLVDMTAVSSDGSTQTFQLNLRNEAVPQEFATSVKNVTRVTLSIQSAYFAGANQQIAISEIQLLGQRAGG